MTLTAFPSVVVAEIKASGDVIGNLTLENKIDTPTEDLNDAQHNSEDVAGIAIDDYSGPKSSLDIYLSFKDMKDNNNEWTLQVGDKIKKYRVTFDPEDNLSDIKQVSRGNLIKRVYSEEESKTKWREKLFGYDCYWGYMATRSKLGYICPAMICDENGNSTGLVLKRILRTRCNTPRLWMAIYSVADDQCYIVKHDIAIWMSKDPETNEKRDYWTNPRVLFDQESCSKYCKLLISA